MVLACYQGARRAARKRSSKPPAQRSAPRFEAGVNPRPAPSAGDRVGATQQAGRDEAGPARLVRRPQPGSGVAVEILVEPQLVVPVRIGLEQLVPAENRTAPGGVVAEDADQPVIQIGRYLGQRPLHPRASRAFDDAVVAEEPREPPNRLDEQV